MGARVRIGGNGALFVGEDKTIRLEVLDSAGVPVNITGWTVLFVAETTADAALNSVTATIGGTYNAVRATNTQRATATLTDSQMAIEEGIHRYSFKRTDDGSESVLAYGDFVVELATQE